MDAGQSHGHRFWRSDVAKQAVHRFRAWGAVHQVRAVTGDSCAVPAPIDGYQGGGRGYGMPDVLTIFADVDLWVAGQLDIEQRLLGWIYVRHLTERGMVRVHHRDGSMGEWMTDDQFRDYPRDVDGAQLERRSWRVSEVDLGRFPCPSTDAYCRAWNLPKRQVLDGRHRDLCRRLAEVFGLVVIDGQ